ncbi:MAG: 2Fe-2S iron-sulfur cluster-binding protein [Candidatus Hydrogenedentes bacterium]|nr:2Fe-2S iron-sulfur cluster-binding protein [Candidatus Hydrogenedentota bacterium]
MATIRFEGEERELPDGSAVLEVCEAMGMPFGCTEGLCGTCRCTVVKGFENLEPLNEQEEDMDLEEGERLACQSVIKSGIVHFSID